MPPPKQDQVQPHILAALLLLFPIILCKRHKVTLTSRRVENLHTCHCYSYVYMHVHICRRRTEKSS